MKKEKKLFEIKIVVFVELFGDVVNYTYHDYDLLTFFVKGFSKHDALFKLMKKDITDLICITHNKYDKVPNFNYWNCQSIFRYELVDLFSIKVIK